jgi:hypothetical protein
VHPVDDSGSKANRCRQQMLGGPWPAIRFCSALSWRGMSSAGSVAYLAPARFYLGCARRALAQARNNSHLSRSCRVAMLLSTLSLAGQSGMVSAAPTSARYRENCQQRRADDDRDGKEGGAPDFVRGIQVGNALRHESGKPLPQRRCMAGSLRLGLHHGRRLAQRVRVKFARVSPATVTNFDVVVPLCHTLTLYLPSGTPAMK